MNATLLLAISLVSATVHVDDYLDVNETYQHAAINRASVAAGVGGEVLFTPGSTYTLRGEVWQGEGQIWRTDGAELATLRRANEVTTTLLVNAQAGDFTIQVSDPSLFSVKEYISPILPAAGEKGGQAAYTRIESISGNTILLNRALSRDYSAGDSVVTTTRLVTMATGSVLESLRIDGNAANNDSFVSWRIHEDVIVPKTAANSVIRNMEFINPQGNSLYITGDDTLVQNNSFAGGNLAAVHIGGTTNFMWVDNQVVGTNQQWQRGGHSGGAFTVSLDNLNITIEGGSFEDVPTYAIGTAHPGTNSDFYVHGVTFTDNNGVWQSNTTADKPARLGLQFIGNIMTDSGEVYLVGNNGNYIEDVLLTDNHFLGTGLNLRNILNLLLFRNEFDEESWQEIENSSRGRFSPADLNNDGDVDTVDLTTFLQNFTGDVGAEGEKNFLLGDTDGDGDVDTVDITIAFQQFTGDLGGTPQPYDVPPPPNNNAAVPEPGSLMLWVSGLMLCTLGRKRLFA